MIIPDEPVCLGVIDRFSVDDELVLVASVG